MPQKRRKSNSIHQVKKKGGIQIGFLKSVEIYINSILDHCTPENPCPFPYYF